TSFLKDTKLVGSRRSAIRGHSLKQGRGSQLRLTATKLTLIRPIQVCLPGWAFFITTNNTNNTNEEVSGSKAVNLTDSPHSCHSWFLSGSHPPRPNHRAHAGRRAHCRDSAETADPPADAAHRCPIIAIPAAEQ